MNPNTAKFVAGLDSIIKGLTEIRNAYSTTEVDSTVSTPVQNPPADTPATPKSIEGHYDLDQLNSMKYNELKKLGASLGVSSKGTREELTERIMNVPVNVPIDEDSIPSEEDVAATEAEIQKVSNVVPMSQKASANKEVTKPSAEYVEMATDALSEYGKDEILAHLSEAGVTIKGRKTEKAIINALALAFENGTISVEEDDDDDEEEVVEDAADDSDDFEDDDSDESEDDDDDESEDDEEDEDDGEEDELTPDSYFSDFDEEGINDPRNMTKKRSKAVIREMTRIIKGVDDESIDEETINEFMNDFLTEDELESYEELDTDDKLAMFCEMKKRLIDDDGEIHEAEDVYSIDDNNFCCGHELKYDRKSKSFVCEVCGSVYSEE